MRRLSLCVTLSVFVLSASAARAKEPIKLFDAPADTSPPCVEEAAKKKTKRKRRGKRAIKKKCKPAAGLVIGDSGVSGTAGGGVLNIPFIRRGNSMFVKVAVHGRSGYMLVDTGASTTTLTPRAARSAGVFPKASYPSLTMSTANGNRVTKLGMMRSLRLGARTFEHVSFTLCGSCGGRLRGKPVFGLLGMNVLGQYRMTINNASSLLELTPDSGDTFQALRLWLRFAGVKRIVHTKREGAFTMTLRATAYNLAPASMNNVRLRVICTRADGQESAALSAPMSIRARGKKTVSVKVTAPSLCTNVRAEVTEGTW